MSSVHGAKMKCAKSRGMKTRMIPTLAWEYTQNVNLKSLSDRERIHLRSRNQMHGSYTKWKLMHLTRNRSRRLRELFVSFLLLSADLVRPPFLHVHRVAPPYPCNRPPPPPLATFPSHSQLLFQHLSLSILPLRLPFGSHRVCRSWSARCLLHHQFSVSL